MSRWLLTLILLVLAGLAAAVLVLKRYRDQQELLQKRLRTSKTYQSVAPFIAHCQSLPVESVTLRPEVITVTLVDPPGKALRFVFEEHGVDDVAPEPLQALAQAFALDLPALGRRRQYALTTFRQQIGAETLRWYEYVIQPRYKDAMLRQRYDL